MVNILKFKSHEQGASAEESSGSPSLMWIDTSQHLQVAAQLKTDWQKVRFSSLAHLTFPLFWSWSPLFRLWLIICLTSEPVFPESTADSVPKDLSEPSRISLAVCDPAPSHEQILDSWSLWHDKASLGIYQLLRHTVSSSGHLLGTQPFRWKQLLLLF